MSAQARSSPSAVKTCQNTRCIPSGTPFPKKPSKPSKPRSRANTRSSASGTTSPSCAESASQTGKLKAGSNETSLFITPGYQFQTVDHLITNFHLPKSIPAYAGFRFCGYNLIKKAYAHAIAEKYRFFSYGDAMLLKCISHKNG